MEKIPSAQSTHELTDTKHELSDNPTLKYICNQAEIDLNEVVIRLDDSSDGILARTALTNLLNEFEASDPNHQDAQRPVAAHTEKIGLERAQAIADTTSARTRTHESILNVLDSILTAETAA